MSTWISGTPVNEPMVIRSSDTAVAEENPLIDRILEIVAVLLLGMTTLGTAWCGFQSSQWSGSSTELAQSASNANVEAARLFGLATQEISYDTMIVAQYAEASAENKPRLTAFYRTSLVRPEFLPILDRWEADVRAGRTPVPLTDDAAYMESRLGPYRSTIASAAKDVEQSEFASGVARSYVQETILLAMALFLAGVTTSFRFRPARALLLAASLATLAVAASQLSGLPVLF